jgi:hypothetical protein
MFMDGFNKPKAMTALLDHTAKSIARPNNDTLYQGAVLDLRYRLVTSIDAGQSSATTMVVISFDEIICTIYASPALGCCKSD